MVTYQQLLTIVVLNIAIVAILFILAASIRKTTGIMLTLIMVCWAAFSWYYQLRLKAHLPANLHAEHALLGGFVSIAYDLGCYLSLLGVFFAAIGGIIAFMNADHTPAKGEQNHTPWPLWILGLIVGLFSCWALNTRMIPQLNEWMDKLIDLIYVQLFRSKTSFVTSYIPVAGIAAGTFVPACFSSLYRRSRVPFIWFLSVVLVPGLTAVLAPLTDLLGSILVLILAFAAYTEIGSCNVSRRGAWVYFLLAIGVGALSSLYFYMNDIVILGDNKNMTLVGGLVSGIVIACLGFRMYSAANSPMHALYLLAFIPYCTPAFGSAVAYILSGVAVIIVLIAGTGIIVDPKRQENGSDIITLVDKEGAIMAAVADPNVPGTYIATNGTRYRKDGEVYYPIH